MNQSGAQQIKPPETLFQLCTTIVKSIIRGMIKNLPRTIGIIIVVMLLHTWLMIAMNDGFNPSGNNFLDMILALRSRVMSGILFWLLFMTLISTARTHKNGFGAYISEITGAPGFVSNLKNKLGDKALVLLAGGAAGGLLFTTVLDNRLAGILLGLLVLGSLSLKTEGFTFLVARLGYSDWKKFRTKTAGAQVDPELAFLVVGGVAFGALVGGVLPMLSYTGYLGAVILMAFVYSKNKGVPTSTFIVTLLGISLMFIRKAYADDGGLPEAGGSYQAWLASEGATTAVSMGAAPSLAAAAGYTTPFLNSILKDIIGSMPPLINIKMPGAGLDALQAAVYTTVQPIVEPGILVNTANPEDAGDLTWNDWFIKMADLTYGLEDTEKIFTKYQKDALDGFKNMIKTNTFLNGDIIEVVDDTKFLQGAKNLTAANKFMQVFNGVTKGFTYGNMFCDTLKYMTPTVSDDGSVYSEGDDFITSAVKAVSSGQANAALTKYKPQLAVFELANYLTFGGTKASDIISPSATVSNTVSLLTDVVKDQFSGTNNVADRLKTGAYGQNVGNLVQGTQIGIEAVKDPGNFYKNDWAPVVTDDKFYDDMYKTADDLFQPPKDAGYIKQGTCFVGRTGAKLVVGVADMTAKGAQVAGTAYEYTSQAVGTAVDAAGNVAGAAVDMAGNAISATGSAVKSGWGYVKSFF
jgi:hypothetical protein